MDINIDIGMDMDMDIDIPSGKNLQYLSPQKASLNRYHIPRQFCIATLDWHRFLDEKEI